MAEFRNMYLGDLHKVLSIIESYDEDDAESAESDYDKQGLDDQFVLEEGEQVIGVTGFREVTATDGTYWLSWTYVQQDHRGKGHGKRLLNDLLDKLRSKNARKLFVKLSDYEDLENGKIYETARHLYESVGFREEIESKDFYDDGENLHILGLSLKQPAAESNDNSEAVEQDTEIADEKPIIRFNGLYEIDDTDGAYTFSWIVKDSKKLFGKRNFTVEDLQIGIESVIKEGGRKIFLTFPSNLPLIHTPLQAAGFKFVGRLTDYYESGVHELHFSHSLNK